MKIQDKDQIIRFIEENREIISQFKVRKLGLFGSFVRDEQQDYSDVDFMVEYETGSKTIDNFLGLINYLESNLEREVELITPESVSKYIKPYIDQQIEHVIKQEKNNK